MTKYEIYVLQLETKKYCKSCLKMFFGGFIYFVIILFTYFIWFT